MSNEFATTVDHLRSGRTPPNGSFRSVIVGTGSSLPLRQVSNTELAVSIDTSDEWITQRTGIRARHIAAEDETTSVLAIRAARAALDMARIRPADVDAIVLATATPDLTFPGCAVRVQAELGCGGAAFDVHAVCAGFLHALSVADNMIRLGQCQTALVIGAETFSRVVDWADRGTCVLFGDGAGAVVMQSTPDGAETPPRGILSTHLRSAGRHEALLRADGGPSSTGTVGRVRMNGKAVFRHAVTNLAEIAESALGANGLAAGDVDWLVPHQANERIITATADRLGVPLDRVVTTVEHHANTSAASIPLALDTATRDGRIQPGQLVLMAAIGAGLTWGAAAVRW
jgi:3-oxoacyl-[acyl-carrier-protein] synthase-3